MNYKISQTISFLIGFFFFSMALTTKENSYAQFSANDTAYLNNFFTEVPYISYWNKPGTWFTNTEISSVQDFFNQMDTNFRFYNHEYAGCYKNILIESDIILDTQINITFNTFEQVNNFSIYGIPNPFAKVKFSLNNKSAYTYFVLDSTTNLNQQCTIAYMVVPGTGQNAMSTFVQGVGYHNLYCQVRNNLKQYGDVYSMSRANEDHRAIFFNKKKLGTITPVQPTFMQSYLNAANRSYGVNQLIETVAMIKYLKSKYDKVFVLGLSTGGKVALWSSMEAEPHAALISSGYTILADVNYQTQLINSYSFGNFLLDLDKDSTKKRLSELKTQFMFTWGSNDNYLAQLEVDSNLTQNYFQGLNNTSYFYNYNSHTFPPCYAIDSFFQRSKNKSTCKLDYNKTNCNKDSVILYAQFCGNPPYTFDLVRDSLIISSHVSNSNNDTFIVYESGNYEIRNVLDVNNIQGFPSDRLNVIKSPQVSGGINFKNYLCDSSLTSYDFISTGKSPWIWHFLKDNVQDSLLISNDSNYVNLPNGDYVFTTIIDSNNCVFNLLDTLSINNSNLSATLSTPIYKCDSNKTHLQVNLTGNDPWMLTYTYNGINQQYNTSQAQSDLYLTNGTYQFISVQDAKGCSAMINAVYAFSYQASQVSMSTPMYNCDSNKTEIVYSLQGNSPFTLQYTQNSHSQQTLYASSNPTAYYSNGQYDFQSITDATGCATTLNQNYTWNFDTISATLTAPMYNCDSNKTHLQINLTGNGPWNLGYINTITGLPYTVSSIQNINDIYFSNGIYQVTNVTDQTQCQSTINQVITNLYTPLTFQKLNESFECDSNKVKVDYQFGGDSPWTILIKDLVTGITNSYVYNQNNVSFYFATGQYSVVSVSDIKCVMPINDTFLINFPSIQVTLSPFNVNCDSGKYETNIQINSGLKPFKLIYTKDNLTSEFNTNSFSSNLTLPNSTYYFDYISDSTGCKFPLNISFQAEYIPFKYNSLTTTYNCEKDNTAVEFDIDGNKDSISLIYLKNGLQLDTLLIQNSTSWITTNGDYKLSYMFDKEGCIDTLDFNLNIDNQKNTVFIDSIHANCNSKVYELDFVASGASPWTIYFNKLNILDSILINSPISTQQFSNGIFNFLEAKDSNGCMYRIDSVVVLQPFLNFTPFLQTNYVELFVQQSNNRYYWYQNNNIIDTISMYSIKVNGDGEYYVAIIDNAGCTYESNKLNIEFPELISLYPNPASKATSLLVDADFDDFWSYSILDMTGKLIEKQVVYQKHKLLDISNLATGSYNIVIEYNKDLKKEKQVLRLIKE
jgi:hypothetical protein